MRGVPSTSPTGANRPLTSSLTPSSHLPAARSSGPEGEGGSGRSHCDAATASFGDGTNKNIHSQHPNQHPSQHPYSVATTSGDDVVFAESMMYPGVPVAYRHHEARTKNPDRLNLDHRHLAQCCILEDEEHLRLLNYQHNHISRISNLQGLTSLVFLDLYSNAIEEMTGLDAVPSLRVLMLGRNRITTIKGLERLSKLDVLDLHNNRITSMHGLAHLSVLRILNLAGNRIDQLADISGLVSLTEINLRRNALTSIEPSSHHVKAHGPYPQSGLPAKIQRCFLSFNNLTAELGMKCLGPLARLEDLTELALDGNPLSNDKQGAGLQYRSSVLELCPKLSMLDMKSVSEEEKRQVAVLSQRRAAASERKELIELVQSEWRSIQALGVASSGVDLSEARWRAGLSELREDCDIVVYGNALDALDKYSNSPKIGSVTLKYVFHSRIKQAMASMKQLPSLTMLCLEENNICSLNQLDMLHELKSVQVLHVAANSVIQVKWFRPYCAHRLPGVASINSVPVSEEERVLGRNLFGRMDQARVQSMHLTCALELGNTHRGAQDSDSIERVGMLKGNASKVPKGYVPSVLEYATEAAEKLNKMNSIWDSLVRNLVKQALELDRKERARAG